MRFISTIILATAVAVSAMAPAGPALAGTITTLTIADGLTALAAGHSYSPVSVNVEGLEGFFAIQARIEGDGTARISYEISADGVNYVTPVNAPDIVTGITKTSGPKGDGRVYAQFEPDFGRYLKIVITETGGANSIIPTVFLIKK